MPNTNFQTFHQMGNAINDVVRQATGRENVQNIDMDFVTVAQRKRLVEEIITGNPVTFVTNIEGPLDYLIVQINPVQDLHGEDSPYPAGGGINQFNPDNVSEYTINSDTRNGHEYTAPGTYAVSAYGSGDSCYIMARVKNSDDTWEAVNYIVNGTTATLGAVFTIADGQKLYVYDGSEHTSTVSMGLFNSWKVQAALSSTIPTAYHPYANICPISGWTGCNVTVSPTPSQDDPDKVVYAISFPDSAGTVYGGTVTINEDGTGQLVVDRAFYTVPQITPDMLTTSPTSGSTGLFIKVPTTGTINGATDDNAYYAICSAAKAKTYTTRGSAWTVNAGGEGYTNIWIPSGSILADLNEKFEGQQIVSTLKTKSTYILTAPQVETLLGVNNIWADSGDVTVLYKNYEEVI